MYNLINILKETLQEGVDKKTIAKFIKDNGITKRTSKVKDKQSLSGANNVYYRIAWENGWLDDLLPKESEEALFKRLKAAAKDVNYNRADFQEKYKSLYDKARTKGLMDQLFGQRSITKDAYVEKAIESWHDNKGRPLYDYSKSKIEGLDKPITINCPKKNHGAFTVSKASNHLNYKDRPGQGCPKCKCEAENQKFIERAKAVHGDLYGYDKVDYCNPEYKIRSANTKRNDTRLIFPIYCKKHQRYFGQRTDIHLDGHGCPACAESKGESKLKDFFNKKGMKIDIGNFENCTNKKTGKACKRLPFDVYVPDLNVIIEYDGKQHFENVPYFFKNEEGYEDQVRRDKLKNDFCEEEGNPKLIRISYMTPLSQISSILDGLLKKAKTTNDKIILASDYPKAGWNA